MFANFITFMTRDCISSASVTIIYADGRMKITKRLIYMPVRTHTYNCFQRIISFLTSIDLSIIHTVGNLTSYYVTT